MAPTEVGLLFGTVWGVGILGSMAGGVMADRVGRKPTIVPAAAVTTAGLATMALATGYPAFVTGMTITSVGSSVLLPALTAFTVDVAPRKHTGEALSFQRQGQVLFLLSASPADSPARHPAQHATPTRPVMRLHAARSDTPQPPPPHPTVCRRLPG
jgi:MFS family permease